MSIKDELNKIEIPQNLSERSRQGIIKAEKSKKRSPILPFVSTIIVTAAALLFVFNYENFMPSDLTNAPQPVQADPFNAYSIAIVVSLIVLALTSFFALKKKLRIHWIFITTIAALSISWNVAKYEMNKLVEPYILPIYNLEETDRLTIYYFVNTDDSLHINTIYINDVPFKTVHPNDVSFQDLPAKERFKNHQLKAVFIQSNGRDFSELLADENTTIVAEFNDLSQKPINIDPFWKLKENQKFFEQSYVIYGSSPDDYYYYSTYLDVVTPFEVQRIEFPKNMLNHFSMQLAVVPYDEEIKGLNHAEKQVFYDFAISHPDAPFEYMLKEGDMVEIYIENMDHSKHLPLLEDIITLQTSSGPIPIVINDNNYLRNYEAMLPSIIERQRGELNE